MLESIKKYITQNHLFNKDDKLLLTVSGGVDSMVLCDLLKKLNYNISIAHCNFQLRGEESDGDEFFVENYANNIGINFHKKCFNTEGYANEQQIGTQEAARNLRYEWFEELMQLFDYQYVITAHHATDNIETVLFNFSNGTGLRGMKGILPKNGKIVRPLLWAKKSDIKAYAETENIVFREDSSNLTEKYKRNYIRHKILPEFKTLNPNFENTAAENINRFKEANDLLDFFIEKIKNDITQTIDNQYFMLMKNYRSGAIGALLDEYERAIDDLKFVIIDVSDKDLATIVDAKTTDEDCRSIQTIMGHVVRAAYGYATYIYKHLGEDFEFRTTVLRASSQEYCDDIDAAFQFNVTLFEKYPNLNLEEFDNNKKILTRWGQIFDYDQLLEHAIVHILRHRRQIEKFKLLLK